MSSGFDDHTPEPDEFGSGLQPQFEFGFSPDFGTFYDSSGLEKTIAELTDFDDRLRASLNKQSAALQSEILAFKEKLRRHRFNLAGEIAKQLSAIQTGGLLRLNGEINNVLGEVDSFGTGMMEIAGIPVESLLPPGLLPGQPSLPQARPSTPGDVAGGIIGGAVPAFPPVLPGGGQDQPPEDSERIGGCPPVDRCRDLWHKTITEGSAMSIAEQEEFARCTECGFHGPSGNYPPGGPVAPGMPPPIPGQPEQPDEPLPQEPVPPPAPPGGGPIPQPPPPPGQPPVGEPETPAGPGPGPTPTDPDEPAPERPGPPPLPEDPIPPPPVPGEGEPPPPPGVDEPDLPLPEEPPPTQPLPPPPEIPDLPPGEEPEEEKPRVPDNPVSPPIVTLGSLDNCFGGPGAMTQGSQSAGNLFLNLIGGEGLLSGPGTSWLQWLNLFNLDLPQAFGGFFNSIGQFLDGLTGSIQQAFRCADPELTGLISQGIFNGFLERWLTDIPDYLTRPSEYRTNFKCPTIIPNSGEATAAYLANEIDESVLECWIRSNGNMFPEWQRVVRANRNKITPGDLVSLLRREKIEEKDYRQRVREQGYLDGEAEEFKELTKPLPGIQDVIRFMVRDVADKELVEEFDLTADFGKKWQGKVKEWGENQGFDEELALPYWIAHWEIPSPNQLYEMFHRLRNLPEGDTRRVTEEQIRTALEQQDIAPFWIDKFLAVSFVPLTRVDVRRAYDIGVLRRQAVVDSYKVRGYDDENAEILAEFAERNKLRKGRTSGPAKEYVAGVIGGSELGERLRDLGYDDEEIEKVVPFVEKNADIETRKKCVPAVRSRFLDGELNEEQSRVELMGWLNDDSQTRRLLERWKCERAAQGKTVPLGRLSAWWRDGILNSEELFDRLLNLKYNSDDAGRIINQLELAQQREIAKSEKAALKQRQRDEAKAEREAEKRAKKAESDLKAVVKARERQQKLFDRYRKTILSAARTASDLWGTDLDDEFNFLWNFKNELQRAFSESDDFVISVIGTAIKSEAADDREEFVRDVRRLVDGGPDEFDASLP